LLFFAWTTSVQLFGVLVGQTGLLENVSGTQRSEACHATSDARPCAATADPTVGPARTPRRHGNHAARVGALDGAPTASLPHPARATRPRSPRCPASRIAAERLALSTTSPAHTLTPVADVRNGRDFSPTARAPIKGAGARRCVRVHDPDVQRRRGSPLRPRGGLMCVPCFPATQTSRHLR
jgi:hypothetical protein